MNTVVGPKELNEAFVRSLPDNGPVVMVNLLRFKKKSVDGDGSGWNAYQRYSKAISPLLKGVGGTILWTGDAEGAAYGDLSARQWEFVVLVRYPSRTIICLNACWCWRESWTPPPCSHSVGRLR